MPIITASIRRSVSSSKDPLARRGCSRTAAILLAQSVALTSDLSRNLDRDETIICNNGIEVTHRNFESVIKAAAIPGFYYLDKKGTDIRAVSFTSPAIFVMSDHKSMPRKSLRYLARLGGLPIALGPKTVFASQCVVLVHNDLDRQAIQ